LKQKAGKKTALTETKKKVMASISAKGKMASFSFFPFFAVLPGSYFQVFLDSFNRAK